MKVEFARRNPWRDTHYEFLDYIVFLQRYIIPLSLSPQGHHVEWQQVFGEFVQNHSSTCFVPSPIASYFQERYLLGDPYRSRLGRNWWDRIPSIRLSLGRKCVSLRTNMDFAHRKGSTMRVDRRFNPKASYDTSTEELLRRPVLYFQVLQREKDHFQFSSQFLKCVIST